MKQQRITLLIFYLVSIACFSQDTTLKEYSYTEFIKLIEKEQDTVFKLKDAVIRFNQKTDSAFIVQSPYLEPVKPLISYPQIIIDKAIQLENVHCTFVYQGVTDSTNTGFNTFTKGVLHNIHFKKPVTLISCAIISIHNSVFDERVIINNNNICNEDEDFYRTKKINLGITLGNNTFNKGFDIFKFCDKNKIDIYFLLFTNTFNLDNDKLETNNLIRVFINTGNGGGLTFFKNKLRGNGAATIRQNNSDFLEISQNSYEGVRPVFDFDGTHRSLVFNKNHFTTPVEIGLKNLGPSDVIEWNQFKSNFYSGKAFENHVGLLPDEEYFKTRTDSFRNLYNDKIRIQNAEVYAGEAALKGTLYRHYRENFDMVNANEVFMNLKDFETERLSYLYEANPSFDTFFTWKVNQFLKVFSNYGTKPSKAITFSVYVVFVFALIYLFFPNSWDRHGKNRILNRYRFFLKYMNKQAGIHEVYLADQHEELMGYDEYRKLIESSDKKVPKFFTSTALPIYKWSISGTNLSAAFLSKIDIMKGTWSELPHHKRFWKSVLLIGAFVVSLMYDIFIKMLNALMLSINTFTTLGFGEIPIKGLPRYLAIIQGFIGWFMLTIFSVSLISQLLN